MINEKNFDFSFSGLKTAVLYYVREYFPDGQIEPPALRNICASFEQAVVDVLVSKTLRAAQKYRVKTVMLGGGVAANRRLREELGRVLQKNLPTTHYSLPTFKYTTDNAAMIAAAGYFQALQKDFTPWQKLTINPQLSLKSTI